MMDMRPEDFAEKKPKAEYDFQKAVNALDGMNEAQLSTLISLAEEAQRRKKHDRRRAEIIAEMNDLFAELIEMDCCLYFNTGKGSPVEVEGDVYEQGAGQIYIN
jgi:hypothetical protein